MIRSFPSRGGDVEQGDRHTDDRSGHRAALRGCREQSCDQAEENRGEHRGAPFQLIRPDHYSARAAA